MVNQRPIHIENGATSARIRTASPSITSLRFDGKELATDYFPPYLFDSQGFTLRIAGLEKDELSTTLLFRNIESDSLSDAGLEPGAVLMGQKGTGGLQCHPHESIVG